MREIPTSFYLEFGRWAEQAKIKGKFSVVPCSGGIKPIDGSLGEYPGHTQEERLEWIEMIKTLYEPRFTITPEIITHWYPWDVDGKKLLPGPPRENDWLAAQPPDVQTRYIAEAMQMLKMRVLRPGGLTMCWRYPAEKDNVLGEAVLCPAEKIYGLKYVMVFNENGDQPRVIFRRGDGAMAVSLRPSVDDVFEHSTARRRRRTSSVMPTATSLPTAAKGSSSIAFGRQVLDLLHPRPDALWQWNQERLQGLSDCHRAPAKASGDRIRWMTGLEICRHFCPPVKD